MYSRGSAALEIVNFHLQNWFLNIEFLSPLSKLILETKYLGSFGFALEPKDS